MNINSLVNELVSMIPCFLDVQCIGALLRNTIKTVIDRLVMESPA